MLSKESLPQRPEQPAVHSLSQLAVREVNCRIANRTETAVPAEKVQILARNKTENQLKESIPAKSLAFDVRLTLFF